ncbi:hypothetical protein DYBT9275_03892 [Dyadobacter sp. CECT 9275]|uniref:asparagine synthase (glutamine-hydrolyzing) n=2 Tax=Dyadobacter helix TaxID=2822344 RepID=A0A916JDG5_9BACT|nr:hypothetical protein DYBT9275_03892 [Dyadobacter sp. CECT 9275]
MPVAQSKVNAILTSLRHRSNDGNGVWIESNVAMGHCLLKVFAQQNFEKQPQTISDCTITADARLDNRDELSTLLGIHRNQLAITADPTIILLAYQRWGDECIKHLEGEFAFAIWNKQNQTLFVATDPIGYRPFYYYNSPDMFIFSSEVKGVVAAKPSPNSFNEESLIEYFYRKGKANITVNMEVFALCGGNSLILRDDKMVISKYWTLESTGKYNFKKDEDWYDCTRELLYRAIEKRLNPEVPTGITLSGGLDSTCIANILSDLLLKKNKPLYAFSSVLPIGHKGIEQDERHYIEIVGRHCPNIIQTYVEALGAGPLSNLDEALDLDETFPNVFFYMDKAILEAAAKKEIRILYNGFGGDYWISNKGNSVIYNLINNGNFGEAFGLIKKLSKKEGKSILHEIRIRYLSHTKLYNGIRSIIKKEESNWQNKTFLHRDFLDNYSVEINKRDNYQTSLGMKQRLETGRIGRTISLLYNRNSWYDMDSSTPLFDKELMEFLIHVPERLFIENGIPRNLIRSAMRHVIPQEIVQRRDKQPYSPGCPTRLINQKEELIQILRNPGKQKISEKYINSNEIIAHISEIIPFAGFGNPSKIIDIRVAQAVIVCYLLDKLHNIGYSV